MTELEPLFVQYLDTEPIKVDPTGCKTVSAFIENIKKKFSPQLDSYPLNKLTLHHYTGTKLKGGIKISDLIKPTQPDEFINNCDKPLLIRYADDLPPVFKKQKTFHPSEERRKRWEELNPILIQAELDAAEDSGEESLEYSSLNWSHISPVYDHIIHEYSQTVKEIPQETMELLHNYLATLTRRLGSVVTSKQSQRLHLIAPILVYVSDLFGPEDSVQIVIEEDIKGVNVKANGHFEFMLKRKNKRVCIVQAKKDNMRQGMVQNLIGMEVASDLDGLDTVYGIVTNYIQWIFLKSQNDRIERHFDVINLAEHQIPTVESLKRIAGKIYALLSEE